MESPVLVWLRRDLRLTDNPLFAGQAPILPVYIHDPAAAGPWAHGAASLWWLSRSLKALSKDIPCLLLLFGPAHEILPTLALKYGIKEVRFAPCAEPWRREEESRVHKALTHHGLTSCPIGSPYLFPPGCVVKADGTPYRVFTPFYRACMERLLGAPPFEDSKTFPRFLDTKDQNGPCLEALCPPESWHKKLERLWMPGEVQAHKTLSTFLESGKLERYAVDRDYLAKVSTSGLSPHLAFGEIAPLRILRAIWGQEGADAFVRQIIWREFAAHTLWHFPDMPQVPLRPSFRRFPWKSQEKLLKAWQKGKTGISLVDAGMMELWETGTMHNRARMIVASFLTKNLLQDWQDGQRWFWDTLVDADLANNSFGWQWVAGCGTDAAPYFRIFNPTLQAQKYDPRREYVSRWGPVLSASPLVDLAASRTRALAAYKDLSQNDFLGCHQIAS